MVVLHICIFDRIYYFWLDLFGFLRNINKEFSLVWWSRHLPLFHWGYLMIKAVLPQAAMRKFLDLLKWHLTSNLQISNHCPVVNQNSFEIGKSVTNNQNHIYSQNKTEHRNIVWSAFSVLQINLSQDFGIFCFLILWSL